MIHYFSVRELFKIAPMYNPQNKPVPKFKSSRLPFSKERELRSPCSELLRRITFHSNIKLRSTSFHNLNVLDSLDELGFNSPCRNWFTSQDKLLSCEFKGNKISFAKTQPLHSLCKKMLCAGFRSQTFTAS